MNTAELEALVQLAQQLLLRADDDFWSDPERQGYSELRMRSKTLAQSMPEDSLVRAEVEAAFSDDYLRVHSSATTTQQVKAKDHAEILQKVLAQLGSLCC